MLTLIWEDRLGDEYEYAVRSDHAIAVPPVGTEVQITTPDPKLTRVLRVDSIDWLFRHHDQRVLCYCTLLSGVDGAVE